MAEKKEELLKDFQNAEDIKRKNLLDIDSVDLSGTDISFYELANDGYHVAWKYEYAPMQLWLEVYSHFIGAGFSILMAILFFIIGNFGGYLTGTVLIFVAGFLIFKGYKLVNKEVTFDLTLDKLTFTIKDMFTKEVVVTYNELKSFELLPTGTDENWGLTLSINLAMSKIIIRGRPKSMNMLKRMLEVMLINIKNSRKKHGKEDLIQIG